VSQQQRYQVSDLDLDASVGDFLRQVRALMELPTMDAGGQPISYSPLSVRAGRHLREDERLGDVLEQGDQLLLHPSVDAGGR